MFKVAGRFGASQWFEVVEPEANLVPLVLREGQDGESRQAIRVRERKFITVSKGRDKKKGEELLARGEE